MNAPDTIYLTPCFCGREECIPCLRYARAYDSDVAYVRADLPYELAKTVEAQKAEIARLTQTVAELRPEPEPRITREDAMRLLHRYQDALGDIETPSDMDELRAATESCLAAMLRSEPQIKMEWQPIASAPRDGTHILVINEDKGFPSTVHWALGEWKYSNHKGGVSHWMPIPSPPAASDAEKPAIPRMKPRTVTLDEDEIEKQGE